MTQIIKCILFLALILLINAKSHHPFVKLECINSSGTIDSNTIYSSQTYIDATSTIDSSSMITSLLTSIS